MTKAKIKFLHKPNCSTCRKAKAFLEKRKAELELRDWEKNGYPSRNWTSSSASATIANF